MIDLSNVAAMPSTRIVRIEHHQDGNTTLVMQRPNINFTVETSIVGEIDKILFELRRQRHDRFQISGKFLFETSRKLRNLRWSEMLSKATIVDRRQQEVKKRGRRKVEES